jgi:hypothetical protein
MMLGLTMDRGGDDGQTLCAFMFGSCAVPAPPKLDLDTLFKGTKKPAPRALTHCKKTPLKVFHISDYHLDPRYVVGSEAMCTGPLVFLQFFMLLLQRIINFCSVPEIS